MKTAFALAAALLAVGSGASAQPHASKGDAFAGYSMLPSDGETRHGWHAALAWGVWRPALAVVLDASGHQGRDAEGTDVDALALMAGPRATFGDGRLRPFVHVIGGLVRSKASVGVFEVEISETSTGFGGAAGGGVDWAFGNRWAVRVAGDYRVVEVEGETAGDPRFSVGVVYRLGAR